MSSLNLAIPVANATLSDVSMLEFQRNNSEISLVNQYGDSFGSSTQQELLSGGDGAKQYGWYVLNSNAASVADVNISTPGKLHVAMSAIQSDWFNTIESGFFLYKNVTGDFDISVQVTSHNIDQNYETVSLAARDPDASVGKDSVLIGTVWNSAVKNASRNTVNGSTSEALYSDTHLFFRINRTGNVFTVYTKQLSGDNWTQRAQFTRNDFHSTIQVGIESNTMNTSATLVWEVDYFLGVGYSNTSPTGTLVDVDSGATSTVWDMSSITSRENLADETGSINYKYAYGNTANPSNWNASWLTLAQLKAESDPTGQYFKLQAQFVSNGTQDTSLADLGITATVQGGGGQATIMGGL